LIQISNFEEQISPKGQSNLKSPALWEAANGKLLNSHKQIIVIPSIPTYVFSSFVGHKTKVFFVHTMTVNGVCILLWDTSGFHCRQKQLKHFFKYLLVFHRINKFIKQLNDMNVCER